MLYLGPLHQHLQLLSAWSQKLGSSSLQFRLTLGVTTVTLLGLGGVVAWTGWQMQRILIASHKQTVEAAAERFQEDVELYRDMMPLVPALERAIQNRSTATLLIWASDPQGQPLAQAVELSSPQWQQIGGTRKLQALSDRAFIPQVHHLQGRSLVLCGGPLTVEGARIGQIYVVADITQDQAMFLALWRSLGLISTITLILMAVAIALFVRRSLRPLRQINRVAGMVSAEDLDRAQIRLEQAPREVRELADGFDRMLERLSQAWEQQRQFVSNVSHELRTPLSIVQGYLQSLLRRSDNLTPQQREALETAAAEASRTIQLLQDLLYLARADSGFLAPQRQPLVLNDLIGEVVGMAEQFGSPDLRLELPSSPVEVRAERNHLIQILLNLIDNAVKYSPVGTPITLRLETLDHSAQLSVSDRGPGIPVQHQARIFERFYRVEAARATGGSGLGLAIVKTLVEGMGGKIQVRSKLGEGSTFTITLPLHTPTP